MHLIFYGALKMNNKTTALLVDQAVSFGGSIVVLGYIADILDKEKYRVVTVTELNEDILKNHLSPEITSYFIPRMFNYVLSARIFSIIDKIKYKIIRVPTNYLITAVQILFNSPYLFRLIHVIIKEKAQIIHVNNGMNNLAPVFASYITGRKCIVHFHGIESPGILQKFLVKRVDEFITVSEYVKNELIKNGFPPSNMHVIYNPVKAVNVSDDIINSLKHTYHIKQNDIVIGIVGRVAKWKGHREFLMAALDVLNLHPNVKVFIVGDSSDCGGEFESSIRQIVCESGFNDRIIFTGYTKQVAAYYNIFDICVHASIEPEPFGLVITEAMAYRKPIVASYLGAPREIIDDGIDGLLVDPNDTDNLASILNKLVANEKLRFYLANNGQKKAFNMYSLTDFGKSINHIYDVLV
jgi:glycosyltransferase involved in cell wall biosynthesis